MSARYVTLLLVCVSLLTACLTDQAPATGPASPITPPPAGVLITAVAPAATALRTPATPSPAFPTAVPVLAPTQGNASEATNESSGLPTLDSYEPEDSYLVAFVAGDDKLNVRAAPGVNNEITAALDPGKSGIRLTGPSYLVDGSNWVAIDVDGVEGWVNSKYLTGQISTEAFCSDSALDELLSRLVTAVESEDGDLLAGLTYPGRGLRLRVSWWNPEIQLTEAETRGIFESPAVYDWGIEDGSGLPISGTFHDKFLPLLHSGLSQFSETACAEIKHGPTTGLVKLPDEYSGVNFVSIFREAEHVSGFDWSTWVVGIERWGSELYIGFLVRYAYEI